MSYQPYPTYQKDNTAVISRIEGDRISVKVPYDEVTINYFKTIMGRRYNQDLREWNFPGENFDSIHSRLRLSYDPVCVREYQPMVHIIEDVAGYAEVRNEFDPDINKLQREFPNTHWDYMKRAYVFPTDQVTDFMKLLEDNHISFDTGCPAPPPTSSKRKNVNPDVQSRYRRN